MKTRHFQYLMAVVVVLLVLGGGVIGIGILMLSQNPTNTTQTTTTTEPWHWPWETTTTTTTTTTTNPVQLAEFSFKAMWDFVPIMQVDPPAWLLIEVWQDDELGEYCDGVYMFVENTWYDASGSFVFTEGTFYRIMVSDSHGFDFTINGYDYITFQAGYVGMSWLLMSGDDNWGGLWFEWTLIV